jgi:hypothetical protein
MIWEIYYLEFWIIPRDLNRNLKFTEETLRLEGCLRAEFALCSSTTPPVPWSFSKSPERRTQQLPLGFLCLHQKAQSPLPGLKMYMICSLLSSASSSLYSTSHFPCACHTQASFTSSQTSRFLPLYPASDFHLLKTSHFPLYLANSKSSSPSSLDFLFLFKLSLVHTFLSP